MVIDNITPLWNKKDKMAIDGDLKRILSIHPAIGDLLESFENGFFTSTKQNAGLLRLKLEGKLNAKIFDSTFKELWSYGKYLCFNLVGNGDGNPYVVEVDIMDHEFAELYWSLLKE